MGRGRILLHMSFLGGTLMYWKSCFSWLAVALLSTTGAQAAPYLSDTDVIFNPHEILVDKTANPVRASWDLATSKSARMSNPTGGVSPPSIGQTVDSFFDIFVELELDGLPGGPFVGSGLGSGDLIISNIGSSGQDGVEVEWRSFSVTIRESPTLISPREVMLRESPSKASLGRTEIRESPTLPGHFQIDSFFDVFTELSVDGGQNWIPASSAMHLESVPEPSTLVLGALGVLGLGAVARRKKKRRD